MPQAVIPGGGGGGGFYPRSVYVISVVDKGALGLFFSGYFGFSPRHIIPAMLHNSLNSSLIRRTSGRNLGSFQKVIPFGNRIAFSRRVNSVLVCKLLVAGPNGRSV